MHPERRFLPLLVCWALLDFKTPCSKLWFAILGYVNNTWYGSTKAEAVKLHPTCLFCLLSNVRNTWMFLNFKIHNFMFSSGSVNRLGQKGIISRKLILQTTRFSPHVASIHPAPVSFSITLNPARSVGAALQQTLTCDLAVEKRNKMLHVKFFSTSSPLTPLYRVRNQGL